MLRTSCEKVLTGLVALLFLFPTAAFVHAQSTDTTITTQTNLVLVPVVVEEKSGQHATGLKVEDFELLDAGKQKQIASFEEVKAPAERVIRRQASDQYSNIVQGGHFNQLTIIALDLVNTPFLDQTYARRELINFLAHKVTAQEPTALISIEPSGVRVLHDFTSDPATLVAALKEVASTAPNSNLRQATGAPLRVNDLQKLPNSPPGQMKVVADFVNNADAGHLAMSQKNVAETTLQAFSHIAEAFVGVPGRKTLIWATASFPFSLDPVSGTLTSPHVFAKGQNTWSGTGMDSTGKLPDLPSADPMFAASDLKGLEPLYRHTIQMLNSANISVYPIDARGLVVFFPGPDTNKIEGLSSYNSALFEATRETMENFAQLTGGKAFYNRNDLDVAFQKATEDSRAYYMLGYYLEKDAKPGWHKLQVKVKQGGVRVLARNGYFVLQDGKQDTAKSDIALAVASPFDYTAMPLVVQWTNAEPSSNKKKVHFRLLMLPSAGIVDAGKNNQVDLQIVAVARDAKGQPADSFTERIKTNLNAESLSVFHQDGLSYNNLMQLAPGEYAVRFVVRDNLSGRIGSVLAPVNVAQ